MSGAVAAARPLGRAIVGRLPALLTPLLRSLLARLPLGCLASLLLGLLLTVGSLGLLRLPNFYQRLHAPTLGTTLGAGAILIGSMIFFSVLGTRLVVHEILIGIFVTITTPVSFILLLKATRHRQIEDAKESIDQ